MKVLLVHNFYQSSSPSGEDVVFNAERQLLESKSGLEVSTYERRNDEIIDYSFFGKALLPLKTILARKVYREIKGILEKEKPEIAHFHNIFYLISPSAYDACKDSRVPVVQTLHNYRFFCVNGLLMRDNGVCEDCVGKLPWRGALRGCYRNSRFYSASVAFMESFHKFVGTLNNKVDAYIALTEFSKKKFIECGLPSGKIFVKPNFLQNPPEPDYSNDGYAIFLGRLSPEKGVLKLIDSLKNIQSPNLESFMLKIIGDGPLQKHVEDKVKAEKIRSIELTGRKSFNECMELLRGAQFMVMPSICYESFPMTIIEAFACGKPVIASRLGAMAELVEDGKTGLLFEPGSPEDLALKIECMIENEDARIEMGKNARAEFEAKYTAEKNYEILMKIYHSVLNPH